MPQTTAIPIAKIIYSRRKTICVTVNRNAEVILKAPIGTKGQYLEEFAVKNSDWILRKVAEQQEKISNYRKIEGKDGERILFLGKELTITRSKSNRARVEGNYIFLPDTLAPQDTIRALLKKEAKSYLSKRLAQLSKSCAIPYSSMKISWAKRRWGSCTAAKVINLSWRLIMCPPRLIDYVIVHELCHTIYMNHSNDFWELLNSLLPQAQALKKELTRYEFVMEYFE